MIPIGDEVIPRIFPIVNWSIIMTCIVVFLWQISQGPQYFEWIIYNYGLIPIVLIKEQNFTPLITHIFLHGGWSHLIGNMLFLFIFGDNIEDRLGHLRYLFFYLICGVGASIFWMLTDPLSTIPSIGASGAISGVLGAYFVFYPFARIRALMGFGHFIRVIRVPAWVMISTWFLYQLLLGLLPFNTGIAYWAHIGGFIVGWVVSRFFRQREAYLSPIVYKFE